MMRIGLMIGTVAAAAAVVSSLPTNEARAQPYPYCAIGGGNQSYETCYYPSYGACMAAVSGVGGHCQVNPRFVGYYDPRDEQPRRRRGRPVRRD